MRVRKCKRLWTRVVLGLALLLVTAGCSAASRPDQQGTGGVSPDAFLQQFGLKTEGEPEKFAVQVPQSWAVPAGAYPQGLYWGLANEYSKDAGLDLAPLKGQSAEVWRFDLAGGLPGQGEQSRFRYPSRAILLVRNGKVAGAWLTFNVTTIGPSVRMRTLEQITGLSFEQWVEREQYFSDPGKNGDLAQMGPTEVLNAFFEAISRGDKTRAQACLSPDAMRYTLTMNLSGERRLYNPGFGPWNSLVDNIREARLLSVKLSDPAAPGTELTEAGDRRRLAAALQLQVTWRDEQFNTPGRPQTRFTMMEKHPGGWKLSGLNTGP